MNQPKVENDPSVAITHKPLERVTSTKPGKVVAENLIQRERRKAQETQKMVNTMRNALPKYTLEEIREFRLPFHEALTMNLEEQGYVSTAAYINELIAYEDEMRKDAPPGSHVAMKPQIKFSKEEIVLLSERLKVSEVYHNEGKIEEECEEFLRLAVYFAFLHSDWWWLGEQLLIQIIKVSSEYTSLEGKYEALSRYAYARFLYEKLKEYEKAASHLEISIRLSAGQGWTSLNYFPDVRGTLFMQSNHALFECKIRDVKIMMKTDPRKAIQISNEARHMAAQACHFNGESKAFVLRGLAEMAINETKTAVNSLLRAFNIQKKFGTVEGQCKVRIPLAKAYLLDNCGNTSLKILMELKQAAEDNNLPYFLGQAYRHLGDYYLSNGEPDLANPLLKETLKIFKECNVDSEEVANVVNLEAISAGLQLFPKYIDLLNDSGTENRDKYDNIMKIVHWKDQRTEFWDQAEHLRKRTDLTSIIMRSKVKVQGSRADVLDDRFRKLSSTLSAGKKSKEDDLMARSSQVRSEREAVREIESGIQETESEIEETEQGETERKRKIKLPDDDKSKGKIVELLAPQAVHIEESRLEMAEEDDDEEEEEKEEEKEEKEVEDVILEQEQVTDLPE